MRGTKRGEPLSAGVDAVRSAEAQVDQRGHLSLLELDALSLSCPWTSERQAPQPLGPGTKTSAIPARGLRPSTLAVLFLSRAVATEGPPPADSLARGHTGHQSCKPEPLTNALSLSTIHLPLCM